MKKITNRRCVYSITTIKYYCWQIQLMMNKLKELKLIPISQRNFTLETNKDQTYRTRKIFNTDFSSFTIEQMQKSRSECQCNTVEIQILLKSRSKPNRFKAVLHLMFRSDAWMLRIRLECTISVRIQTVSSIHQPQSLARATSHETYRNFQINSTLLAKFETTLPQQNR